MNSINKVNFGVNLFKIFYNIRNYVVNNIRNYVVNYYMQQYRKPPPLVRQKGQVFKLN